MVEISKTLAIGAGCYWGTQKYIEKDFQKRFPGTIASASVGFMSPNESAKANPSYREVCTGTTGHVEVLNVELSEEGATEAMFEELIKFTFMFHDPTTLNRQGNDAGTQYASVIFCSDMKQQEIANKVMADLQKAIDQKKVTTYNEKTVQTGIVPYTKYYPAQEDHQKYLEKNPSGYCNHRFRFKEWPTDLN